VWQMAGAAGSGRALCLSGQVGGHRQGGRFSQRFRSQCVLLSLGSPKAPPKRQRTGCVPWVCPRGWAGGRDEPAQRSERCEIVTGAELFLCSSSIVIAVT